MRTTWHTLAALVLAAFLAACSDNGNDIVPTPTTPSTTTAKSDTFSGELQAGGSAVHTLSVATGVVVSTITALSPTSTTLIGTAYGLWDGTSCSAITPTAVYSEQMILGSSLTGTATKNLDNLCVRLYDVGNIAAGTTYTYTIVVQHY